MSTPLEKSLSELRSVRRPKYAELVADQLRRQIICGEIAGGEALPSESQLVAVFDVSVPTVRQAIRVLESEGLVVVERGAKGGPRARPPTVDTAARYMSFVLQHESVSYHDVTQVRAVLESHCVSLLAKNRTDEQLAVLRSALATHFNGTPEEEAGAYAHFHTLVVELAGNKALMLLAKMANMIFEIGTRDHLERAKARDPEERRLQQGTDRTHRKLVDLIAARDADGAAKLWLKHIYKAEDLAAQAINLDPDAPFTALH